MTRLLTSCTFLVLMLACAAHGEDPVYFADANLKAAVEHALGKTNPTPTDMLQLTALSVYNKDIAGLTGLEYATNLTRLWLSNNMIGIEDISPLAGLNNLTDLSLCECGLTDISLLAGLSNLTSLDLGYNGIHDIGPLAGLHNLTQLNLYTEGSGITDISPLAGLTNLTSLDLGRDAWQTAGITDISPLAGLSKLTWLRLTRNYITDISALAGLSNLTSLNLNDTYITDISPLTGLSKLHSLDLRWNELNRDAYCIYLLQIKDNNPGLSYAFDGNGNPPGGVSATDGTYEDRVTITWDGLCPGPGRTDTFQYMVRRSDSLGGTRTEISEWLSGTSFDDTTAVPGVHYWYWVYCNGRSDPDEGWRSAPPQRTLTTTSTTGGSVTTPGVGAFQYDHDTTANVAATPEANYHFLNWTGTAVDAGKVGSPSSASTTVTMDADYTLVANFAIDRHTLAASSTAGGSVSLPGGGSFEYDHNTSVPITAAADAHYHFTAWTGTAVDAGKVANPSLASTTITVDADYSLQANFGINTYILTVNATNGAVTATPDKPTYTHGETVALQATASTRYSFTDWSGDLGGSANPATITMDGNKTVTANFSVIQRTLVVSRTAGGVVSTPGEGMFRYDHGTEVLLQAEPDPLFEFAGWRGSTFSTANPLALTMGRDQQVKAHFVSLLDVLYVDDNGPGDPNLSDPNENGTSEHPFDMIQEAIDVAGQDAKVIVSPGTYFETIDMLGKSITVSGLDNDANDGDIADLPVVDAQGRNTAVVCTQGEDPNCILQGLVIVGGKARLAGGILCMDSSPTVLNCLIVGNRATDLNGGGGIYCRDSNAVFVNCTISGNCGGSAGAGVCISDSNAALSNCIVWENTPSQIRLIGSGHAVVAYTAIAGGWPGVANMDADPCFALPGYWADPANLGRTLPATDPAAVWVGGDYHLLSQAGRWDPISKNWIKDPVTSPCIDAGDPSTPIGQEPLPNGNRINLGVYGGTHQASMSLAGG